ncbi:MAG TPA: hypothetical protein VGJ00_02935 [Rhabdochlamydiaceae bacterium]|jgi:hypothetical protein
MTRISKTHPIHHTEPPSSGGKKTATKEMLGTVNKVGDAIDRIGGVAPHGFKPKHRTWVAKKQ